MTVRRRQFLVSAAATLLTGCSQFPSDGPLATTVASEAGKAEADGYEVIEIDQAAARALKGSPHRGLELTFGGAPPPPGTVVRIGDSLSISIWEASPGGLFSTVGGPGAALSALPTQIVGSSGMVAVPYGGEVRAAGLSTDGLARAIQERLRGKAIDPQVIVTIQQSTGASATVAGDVTGAGRVPLSPKGDRLLEVIAQAGGVKAGPQETFVRVTRGGRTSAVMIAAILSRPSENIYIHPGDVIYVYRQPQSFTALGAVAHAGELPIDRMDFTLAEALGVAGGLNDNVADSAGVFLFRFESASVVRALQPASPLLGRDATVPVIYRLSFQTPAAFFLAKEIEVHSQDIIYVANAPTVEFTKFLNLLRGVAGTARLIGAAHPTFTVN